MALQTIILQQVSIYIYYYLYIFLIGYILDLILKSGSSDWVTYKPNDFSLAMLFCRYIIEVKIG